MSSQTQRRGSHGDEEAQVPSILADPGEETVLPELFYSPIPASIYDNQHGILHGHRLLLWKKSIHFCKSSEKADYKVSMISYIEIDEDTESPSTTGMG